MPNLPHLSPKHQYNSDQQSWDSALFPISETDHHAKSVTCYVYHSSVIISRQLISHNAAAGPLAAGVTLSPGESLHKPWPPFLLQCLVLCRLCYHDCPNVLELFSRQYPILLYEFAEISVEAVGKGRSVEFNTVPEFEIGHWQGDGSWDRNISQGMAR